MVTAVNPRESSAPGALELPNYLDLLRIVRNRKWLLILGVGVGLAAGVSYYSQCAPIFQSEAQVLVVRKRPETVTGNAMSPSHFKDYVNTHRILIASPLIVERAVKDGELRS